MNNRRERALRHSITIRVAQERGIPYADAQLVLRRAASAGQLPDLADTEAVLTALRSGATDPWADPDAVVHLDLAHTERVPLADLRDPLILAGAPDDTSRAVHHLAHQLLGLGITGTYTPAGYRYPTLPADNARTAHSEFEHRPLLTYTGVRDPHLAATVLLVAAGLDDPAHEAALLPVLDRTVQALARTSRPRGADLLTVLEHPNGPAAGLVELDPELAGTLGEDVTSRRATKAGRALAARLRPLSGAAPHLTIQQTPGRRARLIHARVDRRSLATALLRHVDRTAPATRSPRFVALSDVDQVPPVVLTELLDRAQEKNVLLVIAGVPDPATAVLGGRHVLVRHAG